MHGNAILTDRERVMLVELYRGGRSLRECGMVFGISGVSAHKILKKAGEPRRPAGHPVSSERNARVIEMYLAGHTMQQTGDAFGVSAVRVFKILLDNKVKTRPPGPRKAPSGYLRCIKGPPYSDTTTAVIRRAGRASMSDIQPGDIVVCVDDRAIDCGISIHGGDYVKLGQISRVTDCLPARVLEPWLSCRCVGFVMVDGSKGVAGRFRKIRPADEQFIHQIRALKPVREDA